MGPAGIREALLTAARTHRDALDGLAARSESWSRDLGEDILQTVNEQLTAFGETLHEGGVGRLRMSLPSRRIQPVAGRLRRGLVAVVEAVSDRFRASALGRWTRSLSRNAQLRARKRTREELESLLSPPRFGQIPVYYRRLFAPQSHWAGDVVPSAPTAIERARRLLDRSSQGLRSVAVVGVDGAGRGAVVSAILQGASFPSIRRLNLLRPATVHDVRRDLEGLGRGNLVVVTGLGYLMDAGRGGFDPLLELASFILDDDGRNGWLLEADELVWRFAGQAAPMANVFMERVDVRRLERDELERAIFARHHLSGMTLEFVQGERTEEVRSDGNHRGPIQEQYFADLHRRSDGLLQVALTLWLASLDGFGEDAKSVVVRSVPPSPKAALSELPEPQLNLLYVTLRQGWMSTHSLSFIYRESLDASRARLSRMVHAGLFERTSSDVYVVRRHLRGAARRILEDRRYA
jgi:hypothetical protein